MARIALATPGEIIKSNMHWITLCIYPGTVILSLFFKNLTQFATTSGLFAPAPLLSAFFHSPPSAASPLPSLATLLRLLFNFIWLSFMRKSACNSIFHAPPGGVSLYPKGRDRGRGYLSGRELRQRTTTNMRQRHIWHAISTTTGHLIDELRDKRSLCPFRAPSTARPRYPLTVNGYQYLMAAATF